MRNSFPLIAATLSLACTGPPAGQNLGIAVPYEVETLDPHALNTLSNFSVAAQFYESLVTTDGDMRIQPCLARLWENPDPNTWVFHLQPGVTFHSGKPLSAEDVAFTIRRLLKGDGLEMSGYVLNIAEATVLDPQSVRLRTTRPLSNLLNKLRFVSIVPAGSTSATLAAAPDGTGPYRLVEWTKGRLIRLARNERYWGAKAAIESVEILLDRSPAEATQDLLSGRCQLVQCNSRKAESAIRAVSGFELQRRSSLFIKYLGYDLRREDSPFISAKPNPLRDKRVRQAIQIALDRDRLAAGLSSDALPAGQFVPPSIFGFNPEIPHPRHDPGGARELLRQAGLEKGFSGTLHVRKLFAEAGGLVRDQLQDVGIRLELKVMGDTEFMDFARGGGPSLILSRFGAPTGDASDILDTALHSQSPALAMGIGNFGGYSNPVVDRAIEESAGIETLKARGAALRAIMSLVMEDLPWAPLYVDQDVYAISKALAWRPRNDSFILAAEVSRRR